MKTTVKFTTILLFTLLGMGAITLGNYGFASNSPMLKADRSMMAVSDVPYDAPEKADVTTDESTDKVDSAQKKASEKSEETTDTVVEDYVAEADYVPEEDVTEFATDWQSDQEDDAIYEEYEESDVSTYSGGGYENANVDGVWISSSDFQFNGVHSDSSGWSYTYYSENVLPGGGLDIPGRHVDDEGYVCDADGNICIASDDLEYGTVVSVPFGSGTAVVYDSGSGYGNLDIYTSW